MAPDRVVLSGSERLPSSDQPAGEVDLDQPFTVTVYLRPIEPLAGADDRPGELRGHRGPGAGRHLTREEHARRHGAAAADVDALRAFAADAGVSVEAVDQPRRAVTLSGRAGDLAAAFGTSLTLHRHPSGVVYPARQGALTLPAHLGEVVVGVFGLDRRPQATTQFRPAATGTAGYTPIQVAAAYDYPAATDGTGQAVGLIELGGGFQQSDLDTYFSSLGLSSPDVTAVPVDGGSNSPSGGSDGPDGEVLLDIEVVGSIAPKAAIAVYFAPNTDQGFLDAVTTAIHDTANHPSVISISWGGAESTWTAQAMDQMEQAFTDAASLGITVTVAAGDNGSTDGVSGTTAHVDFPASAPHALACGGTHLAIAASDDTESVWNDSSTGRGATGGGISDQFALPAYQDGAGVPPSVNPGGHVGRGVPDVAGDADPATGYAVRVDGQDLVIGGTSAVAPLWAALVARLNQSLGHPVGDIHAALYGAPEAFTDITSGSNGAYQASPGWDACTGLGSPLGQRILAALQSGTGSSPTPPGAADA